MPPEARLAAGLAVALAIVYSATPLAIRVAERLEFYDKPAGYKGHARPTPYLGGSAVMVGFLLALFAVSTADWNRTLPLVGGMAVLWGIGTLDDRHNLAPGLRVLAELALAWMLWVVGLGWDLGLGGLLDLALTMAWVVAVVNAFNLFDNMDGAASTMALVVSAGLAVMGLLQGDTWLAIAAGTLAGACLGFLPHNLASPARIFLGDGGSMPVGFAVAALVMIGSADAVPAWQALVVGLLLVGVPALDTCLVMVSRRRRGVSILTAGRDHLTHRTMRRLRTARAVAMALGAVQALVCALALFAISGGASAVVLIVVLYLVAGATAIALLEAAEREATPVAEAIPAAAVLAPPERTRRLRLERAPAGALVAVFGVIAGASPFFSGFYASSWWVPLGLGLLALATAGAIARPPRLSRPALIALLSLGGLGVWALVSSAWAPSIEQATVEGNRLLVLGAIFASAIVLVRTDVIASWLAGGVLVGTALVAGYVVVKLLGSDPASLFVAGRLDRPLGYINATGTVFLMGFWLCFAVAERRTAWLAGMGVAGATLMGCLALLTQSRGVALAMAGSLIIVMAVVPGDRLRRTVGLLACAAGLAAAGPGLVDIYNVGVSGPLTEDVARRAGVTMLAAALGAGLLWAAAVSFQQRLAAERPSSTRRVRRAAVAVLACGALAGLAVTTASATKVERNLSDQWTAFVNLGAGGSAPSGSRDRLVSGAGARYDYWRVAWNAFRDRPLAGVGAGNYDRPYFAARRTGEDVRQPHSIELQALSELGLVGGALLAAFIIALSVGAWRMRAAALASPVGHVLMIGGVGVVSTWLVHTSVDWMHRIPGVTAVALAMAAVLLRDRSPVTIPAPARLRGQGSRVALRPAALAGAVAAGLALVVAAGSLSRQGLADHFRQRASDALAERPLEAIREANRSLRLDAENPRTYYVKAAALARFNQAEPARRTLVEAAAKEPDDFATWVLLGDLAVRRERFGEAKRNYTRAAALNPYDSSLQALAQDPRQAAPQTTP